MKRLVLALFTCSVLAIAVAANASGSSSADATVSGLDKFWLQSSIQGDRFEINGGRKALRMSSNPAVRRAAEVIVRDHERSLTEAIDLAKRLHVPVPSDATPSQQWELRVVSTMSGQTFDHWYSSLEVQDHMQDIEEARQEVADGSQPEVRSDARDEIPMLRTHLMLAEQAYATTK